MTQVSRKRLDKDVEKEIYSQFWNSLARINSPSSVADFFEDFLTPTEKITLAKRFSTAILLARGRYPTEVKEVLHVSNSKIEAVVGWLKNARPQTQKTIKSLIRDQNWQGTLDKIDELLDYLPPAPYTNWSQAGKEKFRRRQQRSVRSLLR